MTEAFNAEAPGDQTRGFEQRLIPAHAKRVTRCVLAFLLEPNERDGVGHGQINGT